MSIVPVLPPPQAKMKATYHDNLSRLRTAYDKATEIGVPAGLAWRMSFETMLGLNDGSGGYLLTLWGMFVDIDNSLSVGLVRLDGDGVQATIELQQPA